MRPAGGDQENTYHIKQLECNDGSGTPEYIASKPIKLLNKAKNSCCFMIHAKGPKLPTQNLSRSMLLAPYSLGYNSVCTLVVSRLVELLLLLPSADLSPSTSGSYSSRTGVGGALLRTGVLTSMSSGRGAWLASSESDDPSGRLW